MKSLNLRSKSIKILKEYLVKKNLNYIVWEML